MREHTDDWLPLHRMRNERGIANTVSTDGEEEEEKKKEREGKERFRETCAATSYALYIFVRITYDTERW